MNKIEIIMFLDGKRYSFERKLGETSEEVKNVAERIAGSIYKSYMFYKHGRNLFE